MMTDKTILESPEWREIEHREKVEGPDQLLEDLMEKQNWNNAEILWVMRRLIFHYALHDRVLMAAPIEKLFDCFVSALKGLYMMIDQCNPDLDDNIRGYITSKMRDATWGITPGTRYYLEKSSWDEKKRLAEEKKRNKMRRNEIE